MGLGLLRGKLVGCVVVLGGGVCCVEKMSFRDLVDRTDVGGEVREEWEASKEN